MNRYIVVAAVFMVPLAAVAQSLQEQIRAVDTVITQQQQEDAVLQAKEFKRQQAALAAKQADQDQEKKRKQQYANRIHDMQLEDMSLDLDSKRMRVKRTNEFLDQELKRQAVETDVIQSAADVNRNISSGIAENLKSQGKAVEAKAKK